jgi:hypothetical protein
MVAFKTLPSWSFGKAVTQRYCFGRLKRAMCRSQVALSAVASTLATALENEYRSAVSTHAG